MTPLEIEGEGNNVIKMVNIIEIATISGVMLSMMTSSFYIGRRVQTLNEFHQDVAKGHSSLHKEIKHLADGVNGGTVDDIDDCPLCNYVEKD